MANELVNWIEIPVADVARAKSFYESVFQFKIVELSVGGLKYPCFPNRAGDGFCGALVQYDYTAPGKRGPLVYFDSGDAMEEMLSRIVAAGGKIIQNRMEIAPGYGYSSIFEDTEGNMLALQGTN
ncbi:VOC family protein [Pseudochryseolinea flava]|uniref:VOC family protein n=1 Tax=Pseudochryseolinea flava TaxID=2059302 RepID=A0A364Y535_9BACT|nr:VOC family protein [Pseudochryseolinea flava]RAW02106.1 VOC family protein [Pseudochryseolinea flava]